ncbi:MAG: 4Fe-4S dicluster domain-containing protein [Deltaproteobacteria bacterium]|nr:4Fe-4S dicluster domain-containing protein [Deltaproteobacteria bacterium]
MAKVLVLDSERCLGCKLCEIVCSVKKERVSDPSRSRIRVLRWERGQEALPVFCQHCEEPLCALVCPVDAIKREESTGLVVPDREICVGCGGCVSICPMLGAGFDNREHKALRCDLCQGDPACVKCCPTGALRYVDSDQSQIDRKRAAARKLYLR